MTSTTTGQEIVAADLLKGADLDAFEATQEFVTAYLESLGLTPEEVDFQASSYELADKADLVGVPLFLIQWNFKKSMEFAGNYVVVHAVRLDPDNPNKNGQKIVFVDGGTGILTQLDTVTQRRAAAGLAASQQGLSVRKGLIRSDYPANDERPAGTTYYLG